MRHLLCKQFVAWHCNDEDEYYSEKSEEKIYLDLRAKSWYVKETEKLERNDSKINLHIMLKKAATKKSRLRIWA